MNAITVWIDALPDRLFALAMLLGLLFVATIFTLVIGRLFRYMPDYRMPLDVADRQRRLEENGRRVLMGRRP